MPSGSDFKYSTGDTTAWKNKYYALVDYLLSVGASVADIEAFLAENSDFDPGTAPTALANLNAVTATTSDNLEYQITHATPYTSLTANLWFLVRMPSSNAGAMTLKVDDLPAKAVYVGGVATAGGELAAGGVYLLSYNTGSERFDLAGSSTGIRFLAIDHTDSVYTVLSSNLGLVHTMAVDISAGNVDVKELALDAMSGIVRLVVKDWDGVGGSRMARLLDASSSEIWTGYAVGDFIDVAYDGISRVILDERSRDLVRLALTANIGFSASQTKKVFNTSYAVQRNLGGNWNSASTHRYTAPYDCALFISGNWAPGGDASAAKFLPYLNGSPQLDANDALRDTTGQLGQRFELSQGQYFEIYGKNTHGNNSSDLNGDAAQDETVITLAIERIR